MKADMETESAVMAVMKQFLESFRTRDLESSLALFAPDPDVVFIGTGMDEKCIGLAEIKAELERAFSQSEESSIELGWYSVSAAGPIAWVSADGSVNVKINKQIISFPVRFNMVMEQRRDKWIIVQFHSSVPAANQKEGESWPTG